MIRALGVLSGLAMAVFVLSLAGWISGQRLISELLLPAVDEGSGANTPNESSARLSQANESASGERLASTNSVARRAPFDETGAAAKSNATMGQAPKPSVPSQQLTGALSTTVAAPNATPTPSGGPYRAQLMRAPVSRGWGDSYAVRLLNSAGQPVKLSGVLLVAHMADGSVENIAMGALPEPGTYRGTVPTGRSTPVDLRVRVRTGDKLIQIPLAP